MSISCPVCNSLQIIHFNQTSSYSILACKKCRVQFLHPQPDDTTLNNIYNEYYFLDISTEDKYAVQKLKRLTANLYLDNLWQRKKFAGGMLLEIGCGMGDFLLEAQDRGLDVRGIEISEYSTRIANQRLQGERVMKGILEDAVFAEHTFDIIAFFDVLEHVRDPLYFLKLVHKYLKPGGTVYIVTPSLDSWSARLLGKRWMEYKLEHLYYFNQKSIECLMINSGFIRVIFFPNYKVLNLEYVTQHFVRFPDPLVTPFVRMLNKLIPDRIAKRPFKIVASGIAVLGENA